MSWSQSQRIFRRVVVSSSALNLPRSSASLRLKPFRYSSVHASSIASTTARLLLFLSIFCMASLAHGRNIVYDDFNDENIRDGTPANWNFELNPRVTLEGGDVTLWSSNCCGGLGWEEAIDSSVSVRTQARVHSGTIGLASRWGGGPGDNDGYFAWITSDGMLDALIRADGVETEFDAMPLVAPTQLGEDIIFQLDLAGTSLSARYWAVSENPPLEPQWATELDDAQIIESGRTGVYVGSGVETSEATFRYAHLDTRPIPITYDDFEDGNDLGWQRVENIPNNLGGGVYSVADGRYNMRSRNPLPPGLGAGNSQASLFSIWPAASPVPGNGGPDMRNGVLRVKVRATEEGTSIMNGLRNSGGTMSYAFVASTETGEFSISSFRGQIPSTIHVKSGSDVTFGVGEDWILEGVTLDDRVTLKYWREGDDEPATPQLVFLDADPLLPPNRSEAFIGGFVDSNHPDPTHLDLSFDDTYFRFIDGWTEGDFSVNSQLDVADIDRLNDEIRSAANILFFDLTGDKLVNQSDRDHWVHQLKATFYGDANLDGEFNSADLVTLFSAGEYEDGLLMNSTWSTGDFDGDGEFGSSDLVLAFGDGGYEMGQRVGAPAVPEPTAKLMLIAGLVGILVRRLRHR